MADETVFTPTHAAHVNQPFDIDLAAYNSPSFATGYHLNLGKDI